MADLLGDFHHRLLRLQPPLITGPVGPPSLPEEEAEGKDPRQNQQEREERGSPERRLDMNPQECPPIVPHTIPVGGGHPEGILPRCKVRVGGHPVVGIGIVPIPVKTFHLVGETVFLGRAVMEGGKFQGKDFVTVGESQDFAAVKGCLQRRVRTGSDDLVEDSEAGDHHGRHRKIPANPVGKEDVQPLLAP
ncbi:MAG: hypothetical protein BWY86_00019 [Candidatus Aminicenantes bacterium ADurb.Bin508]|nr:MAG: hypothetical protein BWY86_00019 [Candidatus Aminicenantes bacterium ADurb.Bin508]